ncbi:hypothetical protein PFISCL1PPCAC_23211, partial [Pristionchus fissidentatus]
VRLNGGTMFLLPFLCLSNIAYARDASSANNEILVSEQAGIDLGGLKITIGKFDVQKNLKLDGGKSASGNSLHNSDLQKGKTESTQPTSATGLRLPNKKEVALGALAIGVATYKEGGIGCGTVKTTGTVAGGWFGRIGGEMMAKRAGNAVGAAFPWAKPFVEAAV